MLLHKFIHSRTDWLSFQLLQNSTEVLHLHKAGTSFLSWGENSKLVNILCPTEAIETSDSPETWDAVQFLCLSVAL